MPYRYQPHKPKRQAPVNPYRCAASVTCLVSGLARQCRAKRRRGKEWCYWHDPDAGRETQQRK